MGVSTHQHHTVIVEDDEDSGAALQLLLRLRGYDSVRVATNGVEALALLRTVDPPCVILLDLSMPRMGGADFLAQKAADPARAPVPVIIMSGAVDWDAPTLGTVEAVLKPIDVPQLLAMVAKHCANAAYLVQQARLRGGGTILVADLHSAQRAHRTGA
jgi:CheY-like chemotaxis protein